MTTVITLTGDAATHGQHLAAELLANGIELTPADDHTPQDRSGTANTVELVVTLATTAAYDLVKSQVQAWLEKRKLPPDAGAVEKTPDST